MKTATFGIDMGFGLVPWSFSFKVNQKSIYVKRYNGSRTDLAFKISRHEDIVERLAKADNENDHRVFESVYEDCRQIAMSESKDHSIKRFNF